MVNIVNDIFELYSLNNTLELEIDSGDSITALFAYQTPYSDHTVYKLDTTGDTINLPDKLFSDDELSDDDTLDELNVEFLLWCTTSDNTRYLTTTVYPIISEITSDASYDEDTDTLTEGQDILISKPAGYVSSGNTSSVISILTTDEFESIITEYEEYSNEHYNLISEYTGKQIAENERNKFITTIDDGGIKIHDENDEDNYLKIDNDSVDIYVNDKLTTKFGITSFTDTSVARPDPITENRPSIVGDDSLFITNGDMNQHPSSFIYLNNNELEAGSYHTKYYTPGAEPSTIRYNFAGITAKTGDYNLSELNFLGSDIKLNGDSIWHDFSSEITPPNGVVINNALRFGNIVFLRINVRELTASSYGYFIDETLLTGIPYKPASSITVSSYYSNKNIFARLSTTGKLTVKNQNDSSLTLSSNGVGLDFMYYTNDATTGSSSGGSSGGSSTTGGLSRNEVLSMLEEYVSKAQADELYQPLPEDEELSEAEISATLNLILGEVT